MFQSVTLIAVSRGIIIAAEPVREEGNLLRSKSVLAEGRHAVVAAAVKSLVGRVADEGRQPGLGAVAGQIRTGTGFRGGVAEPVAFNAAIGVFLESLLGQ